MGPIEGTVGKWPPSKARLERLVEEAMLDAYGEAEQRTGFLSALEDHLDLPFETSVLGVAVTVKKVDVTEAGEIVAICRRGRERQAILILDLPLPAPLPPGAECVLGAATHAGAIEVRRDLDRRVSFQLLEHGIQVVADQAIADVVEAA